MAVLECVFVMCLRLRVEKWDPHSGCNALPATVNDDGPVAGLSLNYSGIDPKQLKQSVLRQLLEFQCWWSCV